MTLLRRFLLPVFFSLSVACSTSLAVTNEDNLILWYDFSELVDNKVPDLSPNELNATLHNGPSLADGKFGMAMQFNGNNQKLSVPHAPILDTEEYTVSVWFNSIKSNEGWVSIFGRPGRHYALYIGNSNRDTWYVHHRYKDGTNYSVGPGNAGNFPHNVWTHVALTNDGRNSATYVNGVHRTNGTLTNGHNYISSTLYIGANVDNGNGNWYEGLLDDVRLYNVSFSSHEVQLLYNNQLGDFTASPTITLNPPGPISHELNTPFTPPVATAEDPEDGDISQYLEVSYGLNRNITQEAHLAAWWKFEPGPGVTNMLQSAESFNSNSWVASRVTINANTEIPPADSISNAETLVEDNSPATSHQIHQLFAAEADKVYTASIYAKADTRSHLSLSFRNYSKWEGGGGAKTTFDLVNGTSTPDNSAPIAHSIVHVGQDWYRCRITAKSLADFSSGLSILLNDGTGTSYDGDGASQLHIWGAQVEEGDKLTHFNNPEAPGKVYDSTPFSSHGQLVGNAKYSPGKFGMALDLDGAGDYALIPTLNTLANTSTVTISAWANIQSADAAPGGSANDAAIFTSDDGGSRMLLWFNADGAGPNLPAYSMYIGNQSTHLPVEPFSATPNEWQHIAAVYDHSTWKVYIDGQLQATRENARPTAISPVNLPHRIGSWNASANFDYPGLIDDVRIYEAALSDEDISSIYGDGDGDFITQDSTTLDTSITGEWTIRYSVQDSSGNQTTLNVPVVVFDPDAPTIELLGDVEINHEQGEPWVDPGVTISDKDGNPIADQSNLVISGMVVVDKEGSYVLTYDYTDNAGHPATPVRRTIHVADTISPEITLVGSGTMKIQVGQAFVDPGFSATDSFDGELVPTSSILIPDVLRRKAYTPGYPETILNLYNNGGMMQGFPVGEELVSEGPRGVGIYYDGDGDFLSSGIGLPNGDNNRNLFIGYFRAKVAGTYEFGGERPDDRIVVYLDLDQDNVFEQNGEKGDEMMTSGYVGGYRRVELEPGYYRYAAAQIEGTGGSRVDIRFFTPEGAGPVFRSQVFPGGPNQQGIWFADNTFNTAIPGTHTITYTAQDAAGNITTSTRTVIVDDYPDRPKIELVGRAIIKHPVGTPFVEPGATVTDSIGVAIPQAEAVIRGTVNVDVPGKYILTYNYRQSDGLAADPVTRAVEVLDTTAPTITLQGPDTVEIILGQSFIDPGYSATDNFDPSVSVGSTAALPSQNLWLHVDASRIPGVENGDVVNVWPDLSGRGIDFQALKGAPKFAASALNGLPAIEFSGEDILTIPTDIGNQYTIITVSQLEGTFNERLISSYNQNWLLGYVGNREDVFHPGAWVTDSTGVPPSIRPHLYSATSTGGNHSRFYADGRDLTLTPGRNGAIGRLQLGGYTNNFTEAASGFVSEIVVYNRALSDAERLNIETRLATKYNLLGFPVHPLPDFTKVGDHTVLYAATDAAGNSAFATRTVTVKPDTSIPVITLNGGKEIRHEAHTAFVDPGAVVKDGDGNDLSQAYLSVIGTIDTAVLGIQTLTYRYDSEDLSAEPVTRDVLVVDTTPPAITIAGNEVITLNVGDTFAVNDVTAVDSHDGDVTVIVNNPIPKPEYTPGLVAGSINGNSLQLGNNPGNLGIKRGPELGNTGSKPPWRDNYTVIYTGQIFDEDGVVSFTERIDDATWLRVGGKQIINDGNWNNRNNGTFTSDNGEGGWFDFEVRMFNGGGGAGQVSAPGFGYDPTGGTNFVYPQNADDNTADLFRVLAYNNDEVEAVEAGNFEIIYTATDNLGNTSKVSRTIVVLPNDTAPYVVLNGEQIITIEAGTIPTFEDPLASAFAADNTLLEADIAGTGNVDTQTSGTYELTYIFQAQDGTFALPVVRTIQVIDTIPPVITLEGDSFLELLVGETYNEPGATASDNIDGNVSVANDLNVIPNRLHHRGYILGFSDNHMDFEDNGGLFASTPRASLLYNGSIQYGSDGQFRQAMPAINRNDLFQNLWVGNFTALRDGDYNFSTDQVDDRATIWLDKDQNGVFQRVNGEAGDERITWGNQTTPLYLRKGTYKVAISHQENTGASLVRVRFSTPESAGPTALTVVSPASPAQAGIWSTIPNSIDTSKPGRYKINYYAEDAAGNIATAQRTIVIDEDPLKPKLFLLGDAAVTHEAGIPYRDAGVLLEDYNGNPLDESLVTVSGLPGEAQTGQFIITYEFEDQDGHKADPVTRIVNIFDTLPPSIELIGSETLVLPIGENYVEPGAIGSDIFDKDVLVYNDFEFPDDGLALHLSAETLLGSLQDGDVINIPWPDISGMDHHASNRSGDPTFLENALNGYPVVNFDGNDLIWTAKDFQNDLQEYTIFSVARYTGGDSERVISSRGRNWILGFHNNGTGRFYAEGWIVNQGPNDTDWHQHSGSINDRDQANLWRDGVQLANNSGAANNTNYKPRVIQLGGWEANREMSKCEVAEVLLYDRAMPAAERQRIESHLNAKYDLNGGGTLIGDMDTSAPGEYTISYFAVDDQGFQATTTRTVKIVDPAVLPVIALDGETEIEHSSGTPFEEPGYVITNAQSAPIPGARPRVSTNLDTEVPGIYTIAYDYTDSSGNPAQTKIRTITVVDQTGPVITLTGGEIWEHQIGNDWVDPGFVGIDAVEGEVAVDNSYLLKGRLRSRSYQLGTGDGVLNFDQNLGLFAQTPLGTRLDYSSGPRNEGLRIDNQAEFDQAFPALTRFDNFEILWDGHFHTESGGRYEFGVENPDDRASLWIDLDQDEVFELDGDFGDERINPDYRYGYRTFDLKPGFYKFAVGYREVGGNQRIQPRMRALSGKGPSTLSWINPGAANQRDLWVIYNPFDINTLGEHEITYTASDSLGNTTTVTRRVIVKNNPDAPVITLTGLEEIRLPIGDEWVEPGYSVADFEGTPIDTTGNPVRISGEVNSELLGEYFLKYDFMSEEGIPARTARRKVIVADATPPVITLNGDAEITVFQGQPFVDQGATALDDYDGNLLVGSSHNLPQNGLVVHLDASEIKALQDGDPVHRWRDLSPAGNDFKFPVGDPLYKSEGIGGRPAVFFDGTSQIWTETNFGNQYTVTTVSRLHGEQDQRLISSRNRNWLMGYYAGTQDAFHPEAWATSGHPPADVFPHLHTATSAGDTNVRFYTDGADKTLFPKRNGSIGQLQLGAQGYLNQSSIGEVSEVFVYNNVLGTTDRLSLEAFLNAKYGLNGAPEVNVPLNLLEVGTYHILYQSVDGEGNIGTATRTVHVVPDPDAPVITLEGEREIILEAGTPWAEPGFSLSDASGDLDSGLVVIDNPIADNTTTQGEFLITYNYAPVVGAAAPEVTRLVVIRDTEPPVITLQGETFVKLEKDAEWIDPGYSAMDVGTGPVPVISDELLVPNQLNMDFYIQAGGNELLNIDQNGAIKALVPEKTVPFTTGPADRGSDFNNSGEMGAPRGDNFQLLLQGKFFAPVLGVYEFAHIDRDDAITLWLDKDQDGVYELAGDKGDEQIMKVNSGGWKSVNLEPGVYDLAFGFREGGGREYFEVRMTLPEILIPYENERIRPVADPQLGLWASVRPESTVDTSTPGTYTITYSARDITGNATTATRTVVVVEDPTLPFITIKDEATMTHELGTVFDEPGAEVKDQDGNVLEANLQPTVALDITQLGTQTLTYEFTDALPATRTVTVVDTSAPTATLNEHPTYGGTDTITLLANQEWVDPGVTLVDGDSEAWYVSSRDFIPNQLHQAGFMLGGNYLNFDNNGGLLEQTPEAVRLFTTGYANRGYDYNNDTEWQRAGIGITRVDNYHSYVLGYFYAKVDGNYTFDSDKADDATTLWIDLDQNGIFEAGNAEQIFADGGNQSITLSAGYYRTIIGHREGGGGSNSRVRFVTPPNAGPSDGLATVKPAAPDQNGLWLTEGDGEIDTTFPGTHTITYYLLDPSGNSSTITRTVIIEPDPDAPILALIGDAAMAHEQGTPFTDPSVTIKNEAGEDLDPTPLTTTITQGGLEVVEPDTSISGDVHYLYEYDDGARTAIPVSRIVHIADTTPPVLELAGEASVTVAPGFTYIDEGVTVTDLNDDNPFVRVDGNKVQYLYNGSLSDGLISSWGFEENAGNMAMDSVGENHLTFRGTPTRVDSIHGRGLSFNANATAETPDSPSLSEFEALSISTWFKPTDAQADWVKVAIKSRGDFYPYGFGYNDQHQFNFIMSIDSGGINVPADELPPLNQWTHALGTWDGAESKLYINGVLQLNVVSAIGELHVNDLNFAVGGRETNQNRFTGEIDSVAIWNRALTDEEAIDLQHQSGINTLTEGEYQITYTATDQAGNTSSISRTVIVETDPTVPILHLQGDRQVTHEAGTPFEDPGAIPKDSRDNPLDDTQVVVSGAVDHTLLGNYRLTYNFTNAEGKDAVPVQRNVAVVDTTPPTIVLTGGENYRADVSPDEFTDPGFVITDNLDTNLTADIILQSLTKEAPVAHWEFDQTDGLILEELRNNLDGTLVGFQDPVADHWVDGKYGKALHFNGTSSYVLIPGTPLLDLEQFSIAAWVRSTDFDRNMFVFEKTTNNIINTQYNLFFEDSGTINFRMNDGGSDFVNRSLSTFDVFEQDNWHHVLATYDGSIQKLYIDGELIDEFQQDITVPTNPAAGPAYIGAFAPGDGFFFDGLIDDLKIYDVAIEFDEVPYVMQRSGVDTSKPTEKPYVLEYTVTDSSGNTTTVTRSITVSGDTVPPTITLIGAAEITLETGTPFVDPGYSAIDNEDGDIGFLVSFGDSLTKLDVNTPGEYIITYDVMDSSFNVAEQVTRKVIVQTTDPLVIWKEINYIGLTVNDQLDLADPDMDGVVNILEYALGGDPQHFDPQDTLPKINIDGTNLKLTYIRVKSSVDSSMTYKVEITSDLLNQATWNVANVSLSLSADQENLPDGKDAGESMYERYEATATTPIASEPSGKQFMRLVVER